MAMLDHLLEFRRRALQVAFFFAGFFLLFFFFANHLFHTLMLPLIKALPQQSSLIATEITSPVLTPIKLAVDAAILCTTPLALLHLWRFAAPGLYRHERAHLRGLLICSLILFGLGVLFCFYVVLPFMFQFFVNTLPSQVKLMPDIARALSFVTRMLVLFGLCFQVPLICMSLVHWGWVDLYVLKRVRPYVIVAAFILGMLLTPPDVLSQIMLALPLCLLYELGLILANFSFSKKELKHNERAS